MNIHYLQHFSFEGLGSVQGWAMRRGHQVSHSKLFEEFSLPRLESVDWLIVMGGPMNVYEEQKYPWLPREKQFIREAIDAGKRVLGFCLGAQLIASALGAKVVANPHKEIGWFPVSWTEEARASRMLDFLPTMSEAFHWHGETFEIPSGAVRIASSEGCANQGFLLRERVMGLQCHMEMTYAGSQELVEHVGDELAPDTYVQEKAALLAKPERFTSMNGLLDRILDRFSA